MKLIGTKYQIYEEDKLVIYRITGYQNSHYILVGEDGTEKIVKEQKMLDKYVQLTPDAFMNIMLTDHKDYPDVYVCVNKSSNLSSGKKVPDLILRQSIYSDMNHFTNTVVFGDCATDQVNNDSSGLASYMEFNNIDYSISMALYVDDTLESIFDILSKNKALKKIDSELLYIKDKFGKGTEQIKVTGYEDNLKDLMSNNHFIARFREIFNIMQVDWPIVLGKESYNKDGNIILNEKQKKNIEDEIEKFINIKVVIKYDKDVDISKIVSFKHLMVSDVNEIIYLIAYDVIGDYPIDNDISEAMSVKR